MPVIEAKNLSKVFGKNENIALELLQHGIDKDEILEKTGCTVGVNRASFSVNSGEVFVIMGLSGSGKSTLVRLLNRLIDPTEGNILIEDEDLSRLNDREILQIRRSKLSMVFQKFALFPHRTILKNAEYGLEVQNIPREERRKKAVASLEAVGLGNYINQKPRQLSGGMQQRVGLARALANDPEVLLMDEAFSALDPLIRREMQDELMALQAKMKKTIIFITHDLDEALRIGDRIALMNNGSIVQIGTPEEILLRPENAYVERFIENINRSKILTAKHIQSNAETLNIDRDSKEAVVARMEERNLPGMYVVSNDDTLRGYISLKDIKENMDSSLKDLLKLSRINIPQVDPDTTVEDICDIIQDCSIPIVVVREGKFEGIIKRGAVIAAFSKNKEVYKKIS